MNRKILTALLLFSSILAACAPDGDHHGEEIGTATFAVIGEIVGAKNSNGRGKDLNVGLVANFEARLGKIINYNFYDMNQNQANDTAQRLVEVGQTTIWTNPNNGNTATYSPTSGRSATGEDCHYFESNVIINDKEEKAWAGAVVRLTGHGR